MLVAVLDTETATTTDDKGTDQIGYTDQRTHLSLPGQDRGCETLCDSQQQQQQRRCGFHCWCSRSCGAKSGSSAGASEKLSVNPPASLVAALRHVYEEPVSPTDSAALSKLKVETSNALFELRHLLEAVSSHAVFPAGSSSSSEESSSGCSPATTAKQAQANLEKLIMNVLKQATDPTAGADDDVSEATLQGLLIAILSVLTGQKQQPTSPPDMVNLEDDPKKRAKMASSEAEKKATASQQQLQAEQGEDVPSQSLLQVGALLSLLPIHEIAASSNDSATEPKSDGASSAAAAEDGSMGIDGHSLDPALLEYFGAAAAVYEERLEIQKARMLARLQTPPAPKKAPSEERSSSSPPPLLISRRDSDDDDDDDDSDEDGANSIVETPTMSSRARNDRRRSIDPTGEEASTTRNTIESDIEEAALAVQNASDGDEEDEEAEEESSDSEADEEISEVDEDEEPHDSNSDGLAESGDEDAHEEIVNSGDESSSDSEDDDDSDEEAEMMDLNDAVGVDGYIDEEDEAVLQQALAMSMEAAAADSEGNDVSNVVPSVPAQAGEEEEGNLPIPEDVATSANESAETPATRSVDDQQSVATAGDEDQDDASLPPFPRPPTTNPFSFQVGASGAVTSNDPDALSEKAPLPLFSPSQLLEFSALPTSHVLFYLLQYTEMVVTRRLRMGAKTTSIVVGGMGTALFAAGGQGEELQKANTTTPTQPSAAKQDFTLQLLVASFLLMIEQRDDAIENMRKAVAREQRFARDGGFDSDDEGGRRQ